MTRQSSKKIVIVGAKRTPFGRFRGGLAPLTPSELGAAAAHAAMKTISPELVDQVIVGNVLSAGHGMNVARQIALKCGLRRSVPAFTVNMMCGSGMQSAVLAAQAIHSGAASVVLAGGVESMTRSALLVSRPGRGQEPDVSQLADSMLTDGLRDSFNGEHMGITAERLATEFQIRREHQDAWAVRSQSLYQQSLAAGHFRDEIEPVAGVLCDEHPRAGLSSSDLAALNPVFDAAGTVTAGNSSGINDGAAMFVMADAEVAEKQGWTMLCEWVHGTSIGCDPARMGLGPVHAIRKLVSEAGIDAAAIDTLEINEAFAAQTLACFTELGLVWQDAAATGTMNWQNQLVRVNAHGGAIAIGHPLAASGARLICHLAWQIANGHSRNAIAALCIGGGMGIGAFLRQ